jgi:hypothetical protein
LVIRFHDWKRSSWNSGYRELQIWAEPSVVLRVPKRFNVRTDPFERADVTSNTYYDWFLDNDSMILAAQFLMNELLQPRPIARNVGTRFRARDWDPSLA